MTRKSSAHSIFVIIKLLIVKLDDKNYEMMREMNWLSARRMLVLEAKVAGLTILAIAKFQGKGNKW